MNKTVFLTVILVFVLCLPFIFNVQADSIDKFRTQQQLDQFKNKLQTNYQNINTNDQEVIQEKKVKATQYQEKQEVTSDVFDKFAQKSQQPNFSLMGRIYAIPILIIVVIVIILLVVWHQNV